MLRSLFPTSLFIFAASCMPQFDRSTEDVVVDVIDKGNYNAFLVQSGGEAVLIESGSAEGAELLDADIRALGVDPADLGAIILTHGHHDHAGGALHFQEAYGTPVVVGAGDVPLLKAGRNDEICPADFIGRFRYERDQAGTYAPTTPDIVVRERMDLSRFGLPGEMVVIPGHTEGSLIVIMDDVVFVGDMFRGSVFGAQARRHLYMCDLHDNRHDIINLLYRDAPDATVFYPSHFGPLSRAAVVELADSL